MNTFTILLLRRNGSGRFFLIITGILLSALVVLPGSGSLYAQPSDPFAGNISGSRLPMTDAGRYYSINDFALMDIPSVSETPIHMTDFTARAVGSVVYLSLRIKGETEYSTLVFERSVNGSAYSIINIHDAYPSPDASLVLSHSAKDTDPVRGRITYRVVQIKESGACVSQPVSVVIKDENRKSSSVRKQKALMTH